MPMGAQTAISFPMLCQNNGIISFSIGKLTLLLRMPMHRHMYTATYRTVCYGWRVGIVHSIVIVIATAAPDCDLTLPYLPYTTGFRTK